MVHSYPHLRRGGAAFFLSSALVLGAAASIGSAGATAVDIPPHAEPIDDPIKGHIDEGRIQLELQTVAEGRGITAPNWGTFAPGVPGFLYVVDQDGPLWAIDTKTGKKNMVLDTGSLLVPLILDADERGFLGVAFHPDYATNGLMYTMTSEPIPGTASTPNQQPNHLGTVRQWTVPNPTADPLTRAPLTPEANSKVVFSIEEPQFNHNGGALFFGTKGADRKYLYLTLGDGGCADDQHDQLGLAGEGPCISHEGEGNAQNQEKLLGKIIRFDTTAGFKHEIYASGFRNPFRASSDRADLGGTGQIWTADVGQNQIEEIDGPVVQGGNYGWRVKEGTYLFNPAGFDLLGFASDGFIFKNSPGFPAEFIDPVAQYDHDEGVAVIGGFVYRGSAIPKLQGKYVLGDYSDGFNSANGRVMYVEPADRADPDDRTPKVFNLVNGHINLFVLGIGEDEHGELYVLANKTGGPAEETGVVMKLVRECQGDADCRD